VLEHYHHDRLGSTLLVTNWAGVVQQHVRYDAWGKVRGRWSVAGTAMAAPLAEREFTTYETEVETGLQYAGARFYDPEYGMFATLDPARQDANAYGYAGWNPVNATDPNGEIWWLLGPLLIGFAVGFTATFGGMLIGGASMKDAARAGAVAGAVAAVMAVLLQPVLGPMVDNVAKWFAGNVEKPALGYRLLAAGCFAAPSASLGAATGDWSGVIAFGLSAGILVAGTYTIDNPGSKTPVGPDGDGIERIAATENVGSGDEVIEGARLTYAEASADPDDQAAVAHTILNRTKSPGFPDDVVGVVYQRTGSGKYQFDAVARGRFASAGDPSSLSLVESGAYLSARSQFNQAMWGTLPRPPQLSGPPLFFESFPSRPGGWWRTLNFVGQIGRHRFYNVVH
jgi:RHS repeat-associated protein